MEQIDPVTRKPSPNKKHPQVLSFAWGKKENYQKKNDQGKIDLLFLSNWKEERFVPLKVLARVPCRREKNQTTRGGGHVSKPVLCPRAASEQVT